MDELTNTTEPQIAYSECYVQPFFSFYNADNIADDRQMLAPVRFQRSRAKGFKMPENTIYVGRGTRYGNPFKLTPDGWILCIVGSKWVYWSMNGGFVVDDIIELYERWITKDLCGYGLPCVPEINELKGKNLACWCSLKNPCHADVLLRLSNGC
jgi:hypothetical protein